MPKELIALLKDYARRGLQDWSVAPTRTQLTASRVLANRIATQEWQAFDTIDAIRQPPNLERCRFIPMPNVKHGAIERCFFVPLQAGEGKAAFDLLLFVNGPNWLGFRFEPAAPSASTHGYGHVQLNRSMLGKQVPVNGIPPWVPDSYPAFAIRTSDPMQMFLSMATSIHGYEDGMVQVISEVFQNRPSERARYLAALRASVM